MAFQSSLSLLIQEFYNTPEETWLEKVRSSLTGYKSAKRTKLEQICLQVSFYEPEAVVGIMNHVRELLVGAKTWEDLSARVAAHYGDLVNIPTNTAHNRERMKASLALTIATALWRIKGTRSTL